MTKSSSDADLSNVADTKELLIRDLRKLEERAGKLGMLQTQIAICGAVRDAHREDEWSCSAVI
jgi:hypothetical protein